MESMEAYELLLNDVILGDQTLFTRWDGVEASWKFIDPIVEMLKKRESIPGYVAGSLGPDEADKLLEKGGNRWILVEELVE